jgi:hypothetical protein
MAQLNQHMAPDVSLTGVWTRKSSWGAPRPAVPATALVIDPGHAVLIASGAVFIQPVS